MLHWSVRNATQATLNGTAILAEDRLSVCPTATQRYTLLATNAAGETRYFAAYKFKPGRWQVRAEPRDEDHALTFSAVTSFTVR